MGLLGIVLNSDQEYNYNKLFQSIDKIIYQLSKKYLYRTKYGFKETLNLDMLWSLSTYGQVLKYKLSGSEGLCEYDLGLIISRIGRLIDQSLNVISDEGQNLTGCTPDECEPIINFYVTFI